MSSEPYKRLGTSEYSNSRSCCRRIPFYCKIIMVVVAVVVLAIVGLIGGYAATNPLHASCTVDWKFPAMTCDNVKMKLINQIKTWTSDENCKNGGEKCLYTLVSDSGNTLKAKHQTPVKKYTDDLTFTFNNANPNCNVQGYSTSETWYAVLDQGTNYCNLRNLITGSGLNNVTGSTETTSNHRCTQYSSANCEKY